MDFITLFVRSTLPSGWPRVQCHYQGVRFLSKKPTLSEGGVFIGMNFLRNLNDIIVHWQRNYNQWRRTEEPAYNCNLLDFMDILCRWVFFAYLLDGCGGGDPQKTNTARRSVV